jgi:biopolymer transport protein ExbD
MAMASSKTDDGLIASINVTPLVDVVLVLLVVLMVTATYLASHAIPVDLPKAETGETRATTLAVSVDAAGRLYLDGDEVDEAALATRLRAARAARADLRAVIAADGAARHRTVVRVVDLLRREGINQFAFDVDPRELARAGK